MQAIGLAKPNRCERCVPPKSTKPAGKMQSSDSSPSPTATRSGEKGEPRAAFRLEGAWFEGIGDYTQQDEYDMQRLGRKPQLKRNFHAISLLGLTSLTMIAWTTAFTAMSFVYTNGGRAGAIYTWIAGWFFEGLVVASLAEMASMAPTSSGQFHWVSEFAPPAIQRPLSYFAGWLAALTWQTYIATPAFTCAQLVLILINLNIPSFIIRPWHETLMTMAFGVLVFLFNVYGAKWLPLTERIALAFLVIGFFAALAPLWALAPMVPTSEAFGSFDNFGGWASIGGACVVGQITAVAAITGSDAAAHMAEEVSDASRTVPRMMMGTILLNGAVGFVATVTVALIVQNVQTQIVDSTAVYPFIEILKTSVNSLAGATGMTVPFIVLNLFCSMSSMATASRQAFAFARDNGLPFSKWLTKVTRVNSHPLPVNAMLASLVITFIVALLNFGGSEVFDSIYGLGAGACSITYLIGIGSVLWRRLFGKSLPPGRWSLGRFGVPINVVAVLFLLQYIPVSFFPVFKNVTAETMNWGVAMFGGAAVLSLTYYVLWARRVYKGPVAFVRKDIYNEEETEREKSTSSA